MTSLAKAALGLVPQKVRDRLFLSLARERDVRFLAVNGELGQFEGALQDRIIFGEYYRTRRYTPHILALFRSFFEARGSGTFIDIGANIGLVTVPLAQPEGMHAIAIEPEPVNFGCLQRNVLRNGVADRVTLLNRAVYKERMELAFELSETNLGDHRIRVGETGHPDLYNEGERRTIKVAGEPLDDLVMPLLDRPGPVALKLDIQGGEPFVFEGGAQTMARTDLAVTEFWPYAINRTGADLEAFFGRLESAFAFGCVIGHKVGEAEIRPLLSRPLDSIGVLIDTLRKHAANTPRVYTDVLLSKTSEVTP